MRRTEAEGSGRRHDRSHINDLRSQNILLYFVRTVGASFEVPVTYLHLNGRGSGVPAGQPEAISIEGVISTRRANGSNWGWMKEAPIGEWELSLKSDHPDKDKEIRDRFKNEEIEDILFVITYSGLTPPWPV